jgi:H+/Cl- antiporter ClcA
MQNHDFHPRLGEPDTYKDHPLLLLFWCGHGILGGLAIGMLCTLVAPRELETLEAWPIAGFLIAVIAYCAAGFLSFLLDEDAIIAARQAAKAETPWAATRI